MRRPRCPSILQLGLLSIGALLTALVLVGLIAACGSSSSGRGRSPMPTSPGASPGSYGTSIDKPVPSGLRQLPLTNQFHQRVTLASWPGQIVLLVPFLTLCQDVCPLTTGNLLQVEASLRADHAASRVQIIELSGDPARDTSARLAAYAKLTGADWQLVTEPPAELRALEKFFGFSFQKVPEDDPHARDWWTGRPLTYDVDHTDDYFVIDATGHERVVNVASPDFHGRLNPKLYAFLSPLGREHLKQAPQPDWTPANALQALAIVLHRSLPLSST